MCFKFSRVLRLLVTSLTLVFPSVCCSADSRVLQVDGHQIHIGFWGDVKNSELPWAILLSGPIGSWHSDSAWFASLAPKLAKSHRVIAIDRANLITGQADSPVGYAHFAIDVAKILQQLKIEKTIVVAFASSNISLQLLLQQPEYRNKISRALLIEAGKYTERVKQKNAADNQKIETKSRSHLYQFEHPEKLIQAISKP